MEGNPDLSIQISDVPLNFANTFQKHPKFPSYVARRLKPLLKKTSKAQKEGAEELYRIVHL